MDDLILRFIAKCCSYDISKLHSWTRLNQVTSNIWYLVTQLEQQFGCSLSDDKVKKLLTVGDLINVINKSGENSSHSSSNNQQTSREDLYRKAQKFLENNNYPSALQTFRKIANEIDDVWGIFAIYDMCCYSENLKISKNELFQFAYKVVNYYDFSDNFDADVDAHTCWRWLLNQVGYFYYAGQGCQANAQKEFEYFHKAALVGMPVAMSNVGNCYWCGRGVEENHKEALYWHIKSKEAGKEDEDDTIRQLCNELRVSSSIKSTDQYFSKKGKSANKSDAGSAKISTNEQEFVNLIKKLTAISGLTSKKYGVLRRAGNRLNIEDDRRYELLDIALQQ